MTTQELNNYFESTRDENEVSFDQWCLDHEWYQKDNLWVCSSEEDEHEQDGSGDYVCDSCNEPVNKEDWCFTCKDYVHIHHIND